MPVRLRVLVGSALRAITVEKRYWERIKYDAMSTLARVGVAKLKEEVPQPGKSPYATGAMRDSVKADFKPHPKDPHVFIWCDIWYDRYVQGIGRTSPHEIVSPHWIVIEKEGRKLVFPPGRTIHHPGSKKTDYYGITAIFIYEYMEQLIESMIRNAPM